MPPNTGKAIARATYREDELARFFGFFHAGTGAISFLLQLFVTPRLLSRYGVGVGMLVMPLVTEASFGFGGSYGRGALRVNGITVDSPTSPDAVTATWVPTSSSETGLPCGTSSLGTSPR